LTLSNATGSGTLTLTQPSTYSGGTTVAGGTLLVNNASGSGTGTGGVTVNNGAALGGTGTIGGAAAFNPGGILAPGVAGAGTLSFSSTLALDTLSVSKFVVNNTGGVLTKAAVTGTLTPHGSVIHISNSGAPLLPGTYTLFTYSGTVSGSFSATPVFDVGTAVHVSATTIVDDGVGHIKLVVPAPVARNFAMAATIGTPVTVPVIPKYATDPYGDPLTITAVSTPANGTATISGDLQSVTYTATAGTSDSFTYTVSDTYGATATGTVTVTINQAGQGYNMLKAPVVNGDGTVTIGFLGIPGSKYALDWTAALSPTPVSWTPVVTNTAAGNGALNFTVTPVGDSGYYRTRYVAP
jgi:autotransporter-associated beta strand protein